ncbi:hypothetical protein ACOTTU_23205 [Roseobacter sp. EG26]|uniref:hypothetical protein n=1 Tax=Roseobacter sp. EG26 TaxID=3412477 RepID=UPI003CE49360
MWTDNETAVLTAILDELIPANAERAIPAAGELGVASFIAGVAESNAAFKVQVYSLLRHAQTLADGVTTDLVRQLEQDQPDAFAAFLTETYKGYYSRPDMRAKVGVGAHPVHPLGYDVARETPELMDKLTAPVRARGPVFRNPTGGTR